MVGGGTTNHAWSGGAQIVIAKYVCGIAPLEAGYKTFLIAPHPAGLSSAVITVPTVSGNIYAAFEEKDSVFYLKIKVPQGTTAVVRLPKEGKVKINGEEQQWMHEFKIPSGEYDLQTTYE